MKLQQHEITSAAQTCKLPGRIGIKSAAPTAVDTAPKVEAVPTKHHDKMICWCCRYHPGQDNECECILLCMYKSSDDLILSGTGNIRSIPETPGRKYHTQSVTNHLAELRAQAKELSRGSGKSIESKNTETANCLEIPRRARIFLDINVEKYTHRLIRLSLHLVLAFLL